jgi:hypothetical protein
MKVGAMMFRTIIRQNQLARRFIKRTRDLMLNYNPMYWRPITLSSYPPDRPRCWISDHHIFPTQSIKYQLQSMDVVFYDQCLSASWPFFYDTDPANTLRVLKRGNTAVAYDFERIDMLSHRFARRYRHWCRKNVDFFWCSFLPHMSQVFVRCEKPIVAHLSFRFEGNQSPTPDNHQRLLDVLMNMISEGILDVVSSNEYDRKYFEYFSGQEIERVPFTGQYIPYSYTPDRREILIGPARHYPSGEKKVRELETWFDTHSDLKLHWISHLYPGRYEYMDLCCHPAIVVLPYTVYTGAIVEILSMGIPMFFPTPDLIAKWHVADFFLVERKSSLEPMTGSVIQGAQHGQIPDPNDDRNLGAVRYWMELWASITGSATWPP